MATAEFAQQGAMQVAKGFKKVLRIGQSGKERRRAKREDDFAAVGGSSARGGGGSSSVGPWGATAGRKPLEHDDELSEEASD